MPAAPFDWRPATAADVPALAALYAAAARALGPRVYTPEQVAAWASFASDDAGFRRYVLDADTWAACRPDDGAILGFCGVSVAVDAAALDDALDMLDAAEPPEVAVVAGVREIHSLYVAPAATRQGIGSEMLRRTLARAQAEGSRRFAAWATPFSRPVFGRQGFVLARTVVEPFAGTLFERYRVERG